MFFGVMSKADYNIEARAGTNILEEYDFTNIFPQTVAGISLLTSE